MILDVLKVLEENNILAVETPPKCTDRIQPLDLAVNKSLKDQTKRQFQQWYSEAEKRIRSLASNDEKLIDLKLSQLKPLGLKWLIEACSYIDFIKNGFLEAGITIQSCLLTVTFVNDI